jgi:DNA-binding SARP family transcriptional activator
MDRLEFRLLGPFEVSSGRRMILSGGGKRRAVLAVLLLSANEAVSVERRNRINTLLFSFASGAHSSSK